MELIDIYDENKLKTGKTIDRSEKDKLGENEYVISVHCFIINSMSQVLLTQRSYEKNRGGMWEDTHGGLRAGEKSVDGIKRELWEELGIKVNEDELTFYTTLKKKNTFRDIFILYKDIELNSIKFNDGEVRDCKYVSVSELKEIIERGESTFKDFKDTIFYNSDILK